MRNLHSKLALMVSGCLLSFSASAALTPSEVGLIINDADQYSVSIGEYYRVKRGIPDANIIHVNYPVKNTISVVDLKSIQDQVKALPANVQGLAVAWTKPFLVSSVSVDGNLAFCGTVVAQLAAPTNGSCSLPSVDTSSYRQNDSGKPSDYGFKAVMMLASRNSIIAKGMIDNALKAEGTNPDPTVYASSRWIIDNPSSNQVSNLLRAVNKPYNLSLFYSAPKDIGDAMFVFGKNDTKFSFSGIGLMPGSVMVASDQGGDLFEANDFHTNMDDDSVFKVLGAQSAAFAHYPYQGSKGLPDLQTLTSRYINGDTIAEAFYRSTNITGKEILIGDPLTKPYNRAPVIVNHSYGMKSDEIATLTAHSDAQNLEYRWEMPDGSVLFGSDVTWTPPASMAVRDGKEYEYTLAIIDGQKTTKRIGYVLLTTETPGFNLYIKQPEALNFGNFIRRSNQTYMIDAVDTESAFPIMSQVVLTANGEVIFGAAKQPVPGQRKVRISTAFNTDRHYANLPDGSTLDLTLKISRYADVLTEETKTLLTPVHVRYDFPRFSFYSRTVRGFNGYIGKPIYFVIKPLDLRWVPMYDSPVSLKWEFPDDANGALSDTTLTNIGYTSMGEPYYYAGGVATFDSIGAHGPIVVTIKNSEGEFAVLRTMVGMYDPNAVVPEIKLMKRTPFDVPRQCVTPRVSAKNMAPYDRIYSATYFMDGKPITPPVCIDDTAPHEISVVAQTVLGLDLNAKIGYQLTDNQPPACNLEGTSTVIKDRVAYKVIPKCKDIDGKISLIRYSVDGSTQRNFYSSAVYSSKPVGDPPPMVVFTVKDDHGASAEFSTNTYTDVTPAPSPGKAGVVRR